MSSGNGEAALLLGGLSLLGLSYMLLVCFGGQMLEISAYLRPAWPA